MPLSFFFNDTATTEIYTLSLHDALPIFILGQRWAEVYMKDHAGASVQVTGGGSGTGIAALINGSTDLERNNTRLNSSHQIISYAILCLKKKKLLATEKKLDTIDQR